MARVGMAFVLFLFSLAIACQPSISETAESMLSSDKYLEAYDVPIGYENAEGLFAKHDTTYYACFDNWMYYFDTKTQRSGKLCGKVECTHEDGDCNAYLGDIIVGSFQIYDQKIYWLGELLYRMDLDGENREEYRVMDDMGELDPRCYLHRGSIYMCGIEHNVKGANVTYTVRISRYSIENAEAEPETVLEQECQYIPKYICRFYRDKLYVLIDARLGMELSEGYKRDLYEYDIVHKELKNVWSSQDQAHTRSVSINNEGLEILNLSTDQYTMFTDPELACTLWKSQYHFADQSMTEMERYETEPGYTDQSMIENWVITSQIDVIVQEENRVDVKTKYRIYDQNWDLSGTGEYEGLASMIGEDSMGLLILTDIGSPCKALYRIPYDNMDTVEILIQHGE